MKTLLKKEVKFIDRLIEGFISEDEFIIDGELHWKLDFGDHLWFYNAASKGPQVKRIPKNRLRQYLKEHSNGQR